MGTAELAGAAKTSLDLAGRTALITGASGGIGQALALALAQAGVAVCLLGRDAARLAATAAQARRYGGLVVAVPLELTDDAGLRALPGMLPPAFARLDFLVHAAGIVRHGLLGTQGVAELDEQYQLNVRAPYLLTQLLLPRLAAEGSVVFINSMAAIISRAQNGQYAATKAALKALADSLREELRPAGVRVLSVYPGRVATPLTAQLCIEDNQPYAPAAYIQPADLAELVVSVLRLPATAILHDLPVRSAPRPATTPAQPPATRYLTEPAPAVAAFFHPQPVFTP
ncbi:SDR family NAD(P)-dependent oxidoreductase [Hymenobacter algoricola]|uniref:Ketoreductase domain-containing protein n=1 Tax=Hymenobacter algoricola TaxID=486267 RepID=A0ABP7MNA2_9BACT